MEKQFSMVTVRVYNDELAQSLEDSFKRAETSFASNKSAFLVHLIQLGLATYDKEIEEKRQNPQGPSKTTPLDIEDLKELLEDYIKYTRSFNSDAEKNMEICQSLSSAALNVLLESLAGKFIDQDAVEMGIYDKLPKRFRKEVRKSIG